MIISDRTCDVHNDAVFKTIKRTLDHLKYDLQTPPNCSIYALMPIVTSHARLTHRIMNRCRIRGTETFHHSILNELLGVITLMRLMRESIELHATKDSPDERQLYESVMDVYEDNMAALSNTYMHMVRPDSAWNYQCIKKK
jgi:hypothetical protein